MTVALPDHSAPSSGTPSTGAQSPSPGRLDVVPQGAFVEVVRIEGEDALSDRLAASGIWSGVVMERVASAPFGDPLLFRLHGYRLALRRSEAERVCVLEHVG